MNQHARTRDLAPRCLIRSGSNFVLRWMGVGIIALGLARDANADGPAVSAIEVVPRALELQGSSARRQILVMGTVDGRRVDLTRRARVESKDPRVVAIATDGVARALGDGETTLVASFGGQEVRATVTVKGIGESPTPTFERDIVPILTRAGCNAGACHGKARGQNGFALSLLGFDSDFDYAAIVNEARGRRVFPAAPDQSLLILKAEAKLPHGGGRKLEPEGEGVETLRRWVAGGMPRDASEAPRLSKITVDPTERIMTNRSDQQLAVMAYYSNGTSRDVTHLAAFQSNESAIVAVTPDGLIKAGPIPGEAAITARFGDKFATCEVTIPMAGDVSPGVYAALPRNNLIDGLVWAKLERLGITPSGPCDDATFLRRASLDAIGRLPNPEEVRAFLADTSPDKRSALVDRLLKRPEYADFWANKWLDLLRPNPYRVGIKAVLNLDGWVRDSFRRNVPYDEFVRSIVSAKGSTFHEGIVTVFRDRRDPDEIAPMISQLFLGIRLDCAKCHHHPFEVWSQEDFYSFAAFFAKIGRKGAGPSPPISGEEEIIFASKSGEVTHPLTGKVLPPKPLFGKIAEAGVTDSDLRESLAKWMTSDDNPYFAEVIVNRVWTELMTRGIVEPVDDLRATNPASNKALLEALAADFRQHRYDLKHLIKTIMTSYVYGLVSDPIEGNAPDTRNYSRHYRQRLRAEVLLDAISDVTQVPDTFDASPPNSRSMAIWTHRTPSLFLDTFGRPDPNQDPPCERTSDTSVVQVLHLLNSPELHKKVTSDSGRAAKLAASDKAPATIVEELYLLVYGRLPSVEEQGIGRELFERPGGTRRKATEDLLWALFNSPEFIFED
ncbi:DUF1549 domain-containing protein [Singulisphaera sp. PoT]|uniref:DUF1549 domain-containing protein n=1 Tax=Singulisphaera sp. PoT TaxID=3411797 RepID=UPI003BF5C2F0